MARGRFITLEGGEGAGKSTQIRRLATALRARGRDVIETREPGGSPGAEYIRALLVSGDPDRWEVLTEALLHFAARRDHLVRTVWPALDAGKWVLSDRFADSTMAYQGYGQGLDREAIAALYAVAVGSFRPDLTVILDVPVAEGLARAGARSGADDRYERMDADFHKRLRQGFLEIARTEPDRCAVVDGMGAVEDVADAVLRLVSTRFPEIGAGE